MERTINENKVRKQLKIIGIPDDDLAVNQLYLRESIKINQNQYLKLDNTLNGVHLIIYNSPKNKLNSTKKLPKINTFDGFEFSF